MLAYSLCGVGNTRPLLALITDAISEKSKTQLCAAG